jgi:hypothetical protein
MGRRKSRIKVLAPPTTHRRDPPFRRVFRVGSSEEAGQPEIAAAQTGGPIDGIACRRRRVCLKLLASAAVEIDIAGFPVLPAPVGTAERIMIP